MTHSGSGQKPLLKYPQGPCQDLAGRRRAGVRSKTAPIPPTAWALLIYLSIYLAIYLFIYLFVDLSKVREVAFGGNGLFSMILFSQRRGSNSSSVAFELRFLGCITAIRYSFSKHAESFFGSSVPPFMLNKYVSCTV